jgi:DNA-binding MarR family transcriptional regulator
MTKNVIPSTSHLKGQGLLRVDPEPGSFLPSSKTGPGATERVNIFKPSEELRNLRFLEELHRNPIVSQRELSRKFGVALGLTNACLQRMVERGWIRVRALNGRRVGYYLTPNGSAERTRLTITQVSSNVQQYSELKKIILKKFLEMQRKGKKRIVFYGVGDEMEVAYITLQCLSLKLVGIVEDDEKFQPDIILGYELERVSRVRDLKADCILVTSLEGNDERKERLRTLVDGKKVTISDLCVR